MRHKKNAWGMNVTIFTKRYGITIKELCKRAGVAESSLYAMMVSVIPGTAAKVKIDSFIDQYEATHRPGHLSKPLEEAGA